MAIEVGSEAPDFTLRNENAEDVTLSELRGGPVVLVFYPFDFSPQCTEENCQIRDDYQSWTEAGATVFGISRDSHFAHAAFKESHNLKHSLLADMKGETARAYGTWDEERVVAKRLTVVIDGEGRVVYTTQSDSLPQIRDHSDVLASIA